MQLKPCFSRIECVILYPLPPANPQPNIKLIRKHYRTLVTKTSLAQTALQMLHEADDAFLHHPPAMEQFALGLGYTQVDPAKTWQWITAELSRQTEEGAIPQLQQPAACMPPIYSILAWHCWKKDTTLPLEELFAALLRSHSYWYEQRDLQEMGLPCIHFPEESIFSTRFNGANLQVQDPAFLAILCRANECLIEMGEKLHHDLGDLVSWHELTVFGLNEDLWEESTQTYCAYDLLTQQKLTTSHLSHYLPLWAGVPDQEQAEHLCRSLITGYFRENHWPLPTQLPASNREKGQVSLLLNRCIYAGLLRYGFKENAAYLRKSTLKMVGDYGFYPEYQALADPYDNIGMGTGNHLPTAAVVLDLANGIAEKRGFEQNW